MGKGTEEVEVCLSVACFLEGRKGEGAGTFSGVISSVPNS